MSERSLMYQWAVCGIAAGAARFVPVPLLDDVIRQRAKQFAVLRTVRAHGQDVPSELLEPLWADSGSSGSARSGRLSRISRRLLLFPVRKYTAVFGAARGVPTDVMRVVLLARSVDRRLDAGALSRPEDASRESQALRSAVDQAIEGLDLRLLTAGLADGLSKGRGVTASAVAFARHRFADEQTNTDLAPDGPVADSANRVTEVLRRPEIAQLLDRFDGEVDRLLVAPT